MENSLPKIKSGVSAAPVGALIGAIGGYLVARQTGYHNSITVVPFMVVGLILGFSIAKHI